MSTATETKWRRRAVRRDVTFRCEVVTREWDFPVAHDATDISSLGMRLPTPASLQVGDEIYVAFELPAESDTGPRRIEAFARVARVDLEEALVGLEFVDLDRVDQAWLDDFACDLTPSLS